VCAEGTTALLGTLKEARHKERAPRGVALEEAREKEPIRRARNGMGGRGRALSEAWCGQG